MITQDRIIGIVGGMGPQAGIALLDSITSRTQATSDQEHLSTILMSFPSHIVDRTVFLEGQTDLNPAFPIVRIIRKLEKAGAGVVAIACNTAHAPRIFNVITDELQKAGSSIELLNMPYETCRYIRNNYIHASRIGIMATNGTYRSGIYSNLLRSWGYEVILPDYDFQDNVIHKMIYDPHSGIKAKPAGTITPEASLLLNKALCFFRDKNTDVLILGCTELSLIPASAFDAGFPVVDPTDVMALALIQAAICGVS